MAAAPNSNVLVENVTMLLNTFLPVDTRRDVNRLYSAIGVKSHGTIACKLLNLSKEKVFIYFLCLFLSS